MKTNAATIDIVFDVINGIKKTGFSSETMDADAYLGGDLGIDSRELLEILYELEKHFGIEIQDYDKRDLYKVVDVINLFESRMAPIEAAA
jgi:acyl carrier protein